MHHKKSARCAPGAAVRPRRVRPAAPQLVRPVFSAATVTVSAIPVAASDAAASGGAARNRAEKGHPRCCCCQLWRSYRRRRCRSSCYHCPCCSCRNRRHGCRNGRPSCFRRPAERPHTGDRNEARTARGRVRREEMDAMPGLEVACWWKQGQGLHTSHGL